MVKLLRTVSCLTLRYFTLLMVLRRPSLTYLDSPTATAHPYPPLHLISVLYLSPSSLLSDPSFPT